MKNDGDRDKQWRKLNVRGRIFWFMLLVDSIFLVDKTKKEL